MQSINDACDYSNDMGLAKKGTESFNAECAANYLNKVGLGIENTSCDLFQLNEEEKLAVRTATQRYDLQNLAKEIYIHGLMLPGELTYEQLVKRSFLVAEVFFNEVAARENAV